jgi:hypothetical protein
MRSRFARAIRAVSYGAALALPGPDAAAADCRVEPTAAGPVARVTDGRTLVLADGRTVRLAMIEVPAVPPPSVSATERQATAARASSAALAGLVAGNDIAARCFGHRPLWPGSGAGLCGAQWHLATGRNRSGRRRSGLCFAICGQPKLCRRPDRSRAAGSRGQGGTMGRSVLCSQGRRRPGSGAGCAGTFCNCRRHGRVRARERRHHLCQLRSSVE